MILLKVLKALSDSKKLHKHYSGKANEYFKRSKEWHASSRKVPNITEANFERQMADEVYKKGLGYAADSRRINDKRKNLKKLY